MGCAVQEELGGLVALVELVDLLEGHGSHGEFAVEVLVHGLVEQFQVAELVGFQVGRVAVDAFVQVDGLVLAFQLYPAQISKANCPGSERLSLHS